MHGFRQPYKNREKNVKNRNNLGPGTLDVTWDITLNLGHKNLDATIRDVNYKSFI
jgi:hypothetical protein